MLEKVLKLEKGHNTKRHLNCCMQCKPRSYTIFPISEQTSGLQVFLILRTNLGPLSVELIFLTYFTPPMLHISDFVISERYCRHRSDNYIIIPIDVGRRK